jgi:hypothetical protein
VGSPGNIRALLKAFGTQAIIVHSIDNVTEGKALNSSKLIIL